MRKVLVTTTLGATVEVELGVGEVLKVDETLAGVEVSFVDSLPVANAAPAVKPSPTPEPQNALK